MQGTARILVLEDDPDMRDALESILRSEGFAVSAVARGEEAVQQAHESAFDLVVVDIRMEGMDGLDALARVRQDRPEVSSLVVTGYSTEADSIRAIRLGVGDYLKKPFTMDEFITSVNNLLTRQRAEKERRERERGLRKALLWAFESRDPAGGETSRLAGQLCAAVGLGPEATEEVQLATLLAATETAPGPNLPAGLQRILRTIDECWDGSGGPDGLAGSAIPLESRVAAVVVAAALSDQPERAERLQENFPGRFDPAVLEALGQLETESLPDPPDPTRRRGMLSLGRALEAAGNLGLARQTFAAVLGMGEGGREAVEALLGLSRSCRNSGFVSEARDFARRAAGAARKVGSVTAACAALESGILLGDEEGRGLVEEAGRQFEDLGMPAGKAQARLARAALGGGADGVQPALEVLLRPEHAPELAAAADWLLAFLLEQSPGRDPVDRALVRLLRESARELHRLLAGRHLSVPARLAAVRAASQVGTTLAEGILRQLASDPELEVRQAASAELERAGASPAAPMLRIHSLGPLEVYRGHERIPDREWKSPKARYLFAYLAAHRARPVPEDQVLEDFWPGDPERGKRNLYWFTSLLRRCLRPLGWKGEEKTIFRARDGLQLNPDLPRWHDLEEVESLMAAAFRPSPPESDCLRRAVQLYRGPYLEACYMDWAQLIRDRLERQLGAALGALGEWAIGQRRFHEALEYGHRLLEVDSCRQEAHLAVMQALMGLGRSEEAVRQFHVCQRVLAQEFSMEPSLKLLEAHQRALLSLNPA